MVAPSGCGFPIPELLLLITPRTATGTRPRVHYTSSLHGPHNTSPTTSHHPHTHTHTHPNGGHRRGVLSLYRRLVHSAQICYGACRCVRMDYYLTTYALGGIARPPMAGATLHCQFINHSEAVPPLQTPRHPLESFSSGVLCCCPTTFQNAAYLHTRHQFYSADTDVQIQ